MCVVNYETPQETFTIGNLHVKQLKQVTYLFAFFAWMDVRTGVEAVLRQKRSTMNFYLRGQNCSKGS